MIQKIQKAVGLIKRRLLISLLIYIHPKSLKPEWGQCPFDSFDSLEYLAGSWFQKKRPPVDRPVHLLNLLNGGGHSKDPAGRPAHLLILLKGGGHSKGGRARVF